MRSKCRRLLSTELTITIVKLNLRSKFLGILLLIAVLLLELRSDIDSAEVILGGLNRPSDAAQIKLQEVLFNLQRILFKDQRGMVPGQKGYKAREVFIANGSSQELERQSWIRMHIAQYVSHFSGL